MSSITTKDAIDFLNKVIKLCEDQKHLINKSSKEFEKATLTSQELIILKMLEQGYVPCDIGQALNINVNEAYLVVDKIAEFFESEDDYPTWLKALDFMY